MLVHVDVKKVVMMVVMVVTVVYRVDGKSTLALRFTCPLSSLFP